jgi:hypothetical protein
MYPTYAQVFTVPFSADFRKKNLYIGAEVITKTSVYWDITPCCPLKVNGRFGGTYRPYLQDRRISKARN